MARRGAGSARSRMRATVQLPAVAAGALLVGAGLLTGCGQSPATNGSAATPTHRTQASTTTPGAPASAAPTAALALDPCALLERDQAERLAGVALADPHGTGEACRWSAADADGPTGQVEVYVGRAAKGFLESDRFLGHPITAVDGLGDETWLSGSTVHFRHGERWVSVHVVRSDDAESYQNLLIDGARQAAAHS